MTRGELQRERRMEKVRARIVKAELARLKRQEQIREHLDTLFGILTAFVLAALMITAFVIDAYGFAKIPTWVYILGFAYLAFYGVITWRKFK